VTVCFTDRPARLAGQMQTSSFVPLWSKGKDSFLKDILMPPSRCSLATKYQTWWWSSATRKLSGK